MRDFRLPVTIGCNLDDTHQMYHFYIVNTTQVPVATDLRQQITRRFTEMKGVENLPYIPHWLKRQIDKGSDSKALRVVEFLSEDPDSPLYGRIQMANDPKGRNRIKQSSIVNVLKSQVFVGSNPLAAQEPDIDRCARILLNYFRAVDAKFVSGQERSQTVVYKSNGIYFFLGVSKWIFNVIYSTDKDFTVGAISRVFEQALEELDDEFRDIESPSWWMSGSGASSLNRASANRYIEEFQHALGISQRNEIKL